MNNIIVSCGCSFTYGFSPEEKLISFGEIVAKSFNMQHVNLSSLGASNYFVSKQIEHSLNLNPTLIIIGSTTALRFDYLEDIDSIKENINFHNFKNNLENNYIKIDVSNKITSKSIKWFKEQSDNYKIPLFKRKTANEIFKFLSKNTNFYIKKDQDRLMLLGSIFKIKQKNIPFVVIDFDKIFDEEFDFILNFPFKDLSNKFPTSDNIHFNQEGHFFVAEKIKNFIKENFFKND